MRILALDGASAAGAGFAILQADGDRIVTLLDHHESGQGAAVRLPLLVSHALAEAGRDATVLIAALVGPGSFTGLRATLALAHGIALGTGAAVVGVTVGEALAHRMVKFAHAGGPTWCVSQARRDRVFIEAVRPDGVVEAPRAYPLDAIPDPDGVALLAGDACAVVGAVLQARGLRSCKGPTGASGVNIAAAALRRQAGLLAPLPAQPLYVDPPEAKMPVQGASHR